jgi:hypothetical protein
LLVDSKLAADPLARSIWMSQFSEQGQQAGLTISKAEAVELAKQKRAEDARKKDADTLAAVVSETEAHPRAGTPSSSGGLQATEDDRREAAAGLIDYGSAAGMRAHFGDVEAAKQEIEQRRQARFDEEAREREAQLNRALLEASAERSDGPSPSRNAEFTPEQRAEGGQLISEGFTDSKLQKLADDTPFRVPGIDRVEPGEWLRALDKLSARTDDFTDALKAHPPAWAEPMKRAFGIKTPAELLQVLNTLATRRSTWGDIWRLYGREKFAQIHENVWKMHEEAEAAASTGGGSPEIGRRSTTPEAARRQAGRPERRPGPTIERGPTTTVVHDDHGAVKRIAFGEFAKDPDSALRIVPGEVVLDAHGTFRTGEYAVVGPNGEAFSPAELADRLVALGYRAEAGMLDVLSCKMPKPYRDALATELANRLGVPVSVDSPGTIIEVKPDGTVYQEGADGALRRNRLSGRSDAEPQTGPEPALGPHPGTPEAAYAAVDALQQRMKPGEHVDLSADTAAAWADDLRHSRLLEVRTLKEGGVRVTRVGDAAPSQTRRAVRAEEPAPVARETRPEYEPLAWRERMGQPEVFKGALRALVEQEPMYAADLQRFIDGEIEVVGNGSDSIVWGTKNLEKDYVAILPLRASWEDAHGQGSGHLQAAKAEATFRMLVSEALRRDPEGAHTVPDAKAVGPIVVVERLKILRAEWEMAGNPGPKAAPFEARMHALAGRTLPNDTADIQFRNFAEVEGRDDLMFTDPAVPLASLKECMRLDLQPENNPSGKETIAGWRRRLAGYEQLVAEDRANQAHRTAAERELREPELDALEAELKELSGLVDQNERRAEPERHIGRVIDLEPIDPAKKGKRGVILSIDAQGRPTVEEIEDKPTEEALAKLGPIARSWETPEKHLLWLLVQTDVPVPRTQRLLPACRAVEVAHRAGVVSDVDRLVRGGAVNDHVALLKYLDAALHAADRGDTTLVDRLKRAPAGEPLDLSVPERPGLLARARERLRRARSTAANTGNTASTAPEPPKEDTAPVETPARVEPPAPEHAPAPARASMSDKVREGYQPYSQATMRAEQKLMGMAPDERAFIVALLDKNPTQWRAEDWKAKIDAIDASELPLTDKANLKDLLGFSDPAIVDGIRRADPTTGKLPDETAEKLVERINKEIDYAFWPDHGDTHAEDLIRGFADLEGRLTDEQRLKYGFLWKPPWRQRMEQAIYLHDSQVWASRSSHPEHAFLNRSSVAVGDPQEELLIGAIALLHSKTAVPVDQLMAWPDFVAKKAALAGPEGQAALAALKKLPPEEMARLIEAAEIIRLVDASRPIGPVTDGNAGLRNSAGSGFVVSPDGQVELKLGYLYSVPVPGMNYLHIYGQAVLHNPVFRRAGHITFLEFTTAEVPPEVREPVVALLARYRPDQIGNSSYKSDMSQLADPRSQSIAFTIGEIVAEYPPSFLRDTTAVRLRGPSEPSFTQATTSTRPDLLGRAVRAGADAHASMPRPFSGRAHTTRETPMATAQAAPEAAAQETIPKATAEAAPQEVEAAHEAAPFAADEAPKTLAEKPLTPEQARALASALTEALAQHGDNVEAVIDALCVDPRMRWAFDEGSLGIGEGYSLRKHVTMVVAQYRKYFGEHPLPGTVDARFMELFLVVHDLGKPLAVAGKDKGAQQRITNDVIDNLGDALPMNERERTLAKALIDGHPIGSTLKGGSVEAAAQEVVRMAEKTDLWPDEFLRLLTVYYQSDASSYTADAPGGMRSLDGLFAQGPSGFVYDPARGRILFAPEYEARYQQLEDAVARLTAQRRDAAAGGRPSETVPERVRAAREQPHKPVQSLDEARGRIREITPEIGQSVFRGSSSATLGGLEQTHGVVYSAADLARQNVDSATAEGSIFRGTSGPLAWISAAEGEGGLGTSLAYAEGKAQLTTYNIRLYTEPELTTEIERVRFVLSHPVEDRRTGALKGFFKPENIAERLQVLEREAQLRSMLPADHPRRVGGPSNVAEYPIVYEFDTEGMTTESVASRKSGASLSGEVVVRDPLDLKSRLLRAYCPEANVPELRARLTEILGHSQFEVLPIESLDQLPKNGVAQSAHDKTYNMMWDHQQGFDFEIAARGRAAREGIPLDNDLMIDVSRGAKDPPNRRRRPW